jgi:hypothetical protein
MVLWLLACTGSGGGIDRDADGYDHLVDCDDEDATRYPGAVERCDGIDEDCNGTVDDGAAEALTWYADDDGDGFGQDDNSVVDCAEVEGRAIAAGDCDDENAAVNPDALERCDGVDEDCDGTVDEDALDATTVYTDADGDGYGDDSSASSSCAAEGVEDGGDCDDADATIFPGAEELCDGTDTDCDGDPDLGATDGTWWWDDADGDGYGDASADGVRDCAANDRVANRFDCDDGDAATNPADGGCAIDGEISAEDAALVVRETVEGGAFGTALLIADLAADGGPALIAGAPGEYYGAVYTWTGPLGGAESMDDEDGRWAADESEASFGAALASGDIDGDGALELLVGSPEDDDVYTNGGGVWIFPTAEGRGYLSSAQGVVNAATTNDDLGASLALGDVTGDGQDDLLVCGPTYANSTGRSYVVAGPIPEGFRLDSETSESDTIRLILNGKSQLDESGTASALTDLDGDGLAEIVIGAPAGEEVYVFAPDNVGTLGASSADAEIGGRGESLRTGEAIAAPGDIDGDGYADLLIGGPQSDTSFTGSGEAWVIAGPVDADRDLPDDAWLTLTGESVGDKAGSAVGAADIDGDGTMDVVVGAEAASHGGDDAGAVYVVYGPGGGTVALGESDAILVGYTDGLGFGGALTLGDLDGDGRADLAVGAVGESFGGEGAGAIFVYPGGTR